MKSQIILDPEDIKQIVAEKYKVDSDKVEVRCYTTCVGYGMGEREEPTFEVRIRV